MFDLMKAFDTNCALDFPYFKKNPWMWYTVTEPRSKKFHVVQKEQAFEILGEIPGFSSEDVEISLQGQTLTLKGDIDREGFKRSFQQSYTLNKDLDLDNITASVKEGILTVVLPKVTPTEPERRLIPLSTE